jgi:hypothetical protein
MKWPTTTEACVSFSEPVVKGFTDLYYVGDRWRRVRGCEACSNESIVQCCGQCVHLTEDLRCSMQKAFGKSNKPYACVVNPDPRECRGECQLEFVCTGGPLVGKVRRARDVRDVLRNPDGSAFTS